MYLSHDDYHALAMKFIAAGPSMLLLRGPSGSGKSSLATNFIRMGRGKVVTSYESDDFFMVNGQYRFRFELLPYAHNLCLSRVAQQYHRQGKFPHWVIVSNTGISRIKNQYPEIARNYGHNVFYYDMPALTAYANSDAAGRQDIVTTLAKNNVHGLTPELITNQCEKLLSQGKEVGIETL